MPKKEKSGFKYKLSPSRLNLYRECPRCFWLSLNKGLGRPDGPFPSLPSGIDGVLKRHFDEYRKKGQLPKFLKDHNLDVKLFNDITLLDEWRNNFKGVRYVDKKHNVLLRGAVDEILMRDDELVILDFKTRGFPIKEDTHKSYQDQLNLYRFLLVKNGHKVSRRGYLLFFHPLTIMDDGKFILKTEIVDMSLSAEEGEKLFNKAVKVLEGKMPAASKDCGFCKWHGEMRVY